MHEHMHTGKVHTARGYQRVHATQAAAPEQASKVPSPKAAEAVLKAARLASGVIGAGASAGVAAATLPCMCMTPSVSVWTCAWTNAETRASTHIPTQICAVFFW